MSKLILKVVFKEGGSRVLRADDISLASSVVQATIHYEKSEKNFQFPASILVSATAMTDDGATISYKIYEDRIYV